MNYGLCLEGSHSAVTGLKYEDDFSCDLENWKADTGFWSKLLKREDTIHIKKLMDVHLIEVPTWSDEKDRIRFVYVCVIAGLIMATDEKKIIPLSYIQMVMDLDKVRNYPWGLVSFDHLVKSIIKTRKSLKNVKSYALDGFSYALQIWVMEAIPVIGELLGAKINKELTGSPRCSNWKGAAKVSYDDIIILEKSIGPKDVVFPYISFTGNCDIFESMDFLRPDEIIDCEVHNLNELISSGCDFGDHVWENVVDVVDGDETQNVEEHDGVAADNDVPENGNEISHLTDDENQVCVNSQKNEVDNEPMSSLMRIKKKQADRGAETRKKKLLCQRAATTHGSFDEEIKTFITGFEASFKRFEYNFGMRMGKLEEKVSQINEWLSISGVARNTKETILQPSNPIPPVVHHKSMDEKYLLDDLFSESCGIDLNMGTQDFLQNEVGHLEQKKQVPDFDPTQNLCGEGEYINLRPIKIEKVAEEVATKKAEPTSPSLLKSGKIAKDSVLVFVSDDKWDAFQQWSMKHQSLTLGPATIDNTLLHRVMGPNVWLRNNEMDAMMYLFRENTSLGRLKSDRVGFMNCIFSMKLQNEHMKYLSSTNKRTHKWERLLLSYATGELPSHGKTGKKWGSDLDRIYAPISINGNHWISVCVNFVLRTVEVFDCSNHNQRRNVEPFASTIPRLLKEIHSMDAFGKKLLLSPYTITHVHMQPGLNNSCCDCGVYALKHIECHLLQLNMDLINDDNIREARFRIAVDLWEAANDPVFIERMKKYVPPQCSSDIVNLE